MHLRAWQRPQPTAANLKKKKGMSGALHWETVDELEVSADYAYVFLKTGLAHVLPRASIVEGNFDEFVKAVRERLPGYGVRDPA